MRVPDLEFAGLLQSIGEYRKKYYQNQLFKGSLIAIALLLSLFLLLNTLEYFGRFNSLIRGMLLFGYLTVFTYISFRWVLRPLLFLTGLSKPISDEEAARQIGRFFPSIDDKLLNTLQLGLLEETHSDLIKASIRQKSGELLVVRFTEAVNFRENSRYLKYAAYPIAALAFILLFKPSFLTSSSERLLKFNTSFQSAPFAFILQNETLKAFRNDDLKIQVKLEGDALPEHVYLLSNDARFKLEQETGNLYSYTFKNIQKELNFQFDAAGFRSEPYRILLAERPGLLSFDVKLEYPAYLGKPAESMSNVGNLKIPEGTRIQWKFRTASTKNMAVVFEGDSLLSNAAGKSNNTFEVSKTLHKSSAYTIVLTNDDVPDGLPARYFADIIPDLHPEMILENFQDTTLYNFLVVGGTISDDYGFTQLKLFYNVIRKDEEQKENTSFKALPIPFNNKVNNQSYYFQWHLDSLDLRPGDRLEYYAQVWDNDGVNGAKSTRSKSLVFSLPEKQQIQTEIARSVEETQQQIENTLSKARELEKDLRDLENKLKANNELDFQERKMAEDILKKREELIQQIQSLQEKNKVSNQKSRQFEQQSESFQKKMDELQNLMNELIRDDSKKLYNELEKLLEQNQSERMSKLLERLKNKESGSEKELERTLNLFKKLRLEQETESAIEDLKELAEEQEELAENTEKVLDGKNGDEPSEKQQDLLREQEKITRDFEDILKKLENIEEMGKEIGQEADMQKEEQENARDAQSQSTQQLSKKQNKNASESQKKAGKSMRSIAQGLEENQQSAQSMQMQEDMDSLRDILENLHTLSFDQEQLMKDFKGVSLSDPRFVQLGQKQLKLQDDSKIVEDSLYALANRVLEIKSFITRELDDMKYYMNESVKHIKDRKLPHIASHQQFAMTSANNLALMLSDVFARMQESLAKAMMMPGASDKPGEGNSPGDMQQQLNQKMREMGKGKSGDQPGMSEQLARMAAEQAAIRELVRKLLDGQKGNKFSDQYGQELNNIMEQMERSETEIVNKRVSQKLIERNEEMLTRLLESEKALREQDEDEQRKGETARQILKQPPPAFQEYIKNKSLQTELLRTVPPNFTPFYKKETDFYFQNPPGSR